MDAPDKKPTFLIVGAVKAGTTSLHEYLSHHPQVYMSPVKETNFFSDADMDFAHFNIDYRQDIGHDLKKYLAGPMDHKIHIAHVREWKDYLTLFKNAKDETALGEVSNSYLYCPSAAAAILAKLPDARIVMILRNPAKRLFSQYLMNLRLGKIAGRGLLDEIAHDQAKTHKGWGVSHLYLETGLYFAQVKRYYDLFPASRIHVMLYDDFKRDAAGEMKKLFRFLGVEALELDMQRRYNEAGMPRFGKLNYWMTQLGVYGLVKKIFSPAMKEKLKKLAFTKKNIPVMSAEERKYLTDYYRSDTKQLAALISRDLGMWL